MAKKKPRVALHYVKPGISRSPNILFDRMESSKYLQQKYEFAHLNQSTLPGGKIDFKLIKTLIKEIKSVEPDIIHISGISEGFHCMVAAKLAGCKNRIIITHGFSSMVKNQPIFKRLVFKYFIEPITLLLATKIQCNSNFSLNQSVIKLFGKNKSECIYNIPPDIEIGNTNISFREEYQISDDEIVFVTAGRIVKDKGFEILTNAIKMLNGYEKIRFVIIGEGEYKPVLEMSLKSEIEKKRVILTGSIQNTQVLRIMSESSVFVLPTMLFETYGLVFIEAALVKLPSIGTNLGAVPEVVKDNETGILIPINNVEALVNAIKYFYNHPECVKSMGEKAYNRASELFSKHTITKDIDKMYKKCMLVKYNRKSRLR